MVTSVRSSIRCPYAHAWIALILGICTALNAQDNEVYTVGVKLRAGGRAVAGYLHSVNDTVLTILSGGGGRKGLEKAMMHPQLIAIPTSLIKKVAIVHARASGEWFLSTVLISASYSIVYLLLVPLQPTLGSLIIYTATVTTATIFTAGLLYVRKYKPTETGFTIRMQKYCLVKSGIVADGQ